MQAVAGAIAREDWTKVAGIALRIAVHPQPPLNERLRIRAYIRSDMRRFKGFDPLTHEVAVAMQQAAQRQDGRGVIAAFTEVQRGCLGCLRPSASPFVAHFYGDVVAKNAN